MTIYLVAGTFYISCNVRIENSTSLYYPEEMAEGKSGPSFADGNTRIV